MIRCRRFSLLMLAAAAGAGAAKADVLEIGPSGHTWIAGGPVEAIAVGTVTTAQSASPVSEPSLSAGPEPWRGHVARIAAKYDISPQLLEALVWQESRWHPGAVSSAGARGLAQLMPGTARELGVDLNDPLSNLEGGARYLRQQLDTFGGDLEKALAAYNAGPHRVIRAGGVPRIRETRNYVAAILGRLSQPVRR